jgi:hypothetical protein
MCRNVLSDDKHSNDLPGRGGSSQCIACGRRQRSLLPPGRILSAIVDSIHCSSVVRIMMFIADDAAA